MERLLRVPGFGNEFLVEFDGADGAVEAELFEQGDDRASVRERSGFTVDRHDHARTVGWDWCEHGLGFYTLRNVPLMIRRVRRSAGLSLGACCVAALVAVLTAGCERTPRYPRATPDDVLKSAAMMVNDHHAEQLGTLIWADSPEMRAVLDRLGVLCGHLQELSAKVEEKFPEEFRQLRESAGTEASSAKTNPLFGAIFGQGGAGKRGGASINPEQIRSWLNALMADPYAWLERSGKRLSTTQSADDAAFVLLDGQPAIPVVGLPMKREAGVWYVVLPLNVPPVSQAMPRTAREWQIMGSIVLILDRTVVELTADAKTGRLRGVDDLLAQAQDKITFPAIFAFATYMKELDIRQQTDRVVAAFETRLAVWAAERKAEGGGSVSNEVLGKLSQMGAAEAEASVRGKKPLKFKDMTREQFEELLSGWGRARGVELQFGGG